MAGLTSLPLPSPELVRQRYFYSIISGKFYHLTSPCNSVKVGDEAGVLHKSTGRCYIKINGVAYSRARLAWLWVTGEDPGELPVDHINRDRSDDSWINLRLATDTENNLNRGEMPRVVNKYPCVYYRSGTHQAVIRRNGVRIDLGSYQTAEEAHQAILNYEKYYTMVG